jgi:hypothetical protein
MMIRIKVDPQTVWIETVSIARLKDDQEGVLRSFRADVMVHDPEAGELTRIGAVQGLVAFESTEVQLAMAANAISNEALTLAHAADEIRRSLDNYAEVTPSTVLLVDLIRIKPQWRGSRICGHIISQLLEVLRLHPETTLVVLEPEPQFEDGARMRRGPQRTAALAHLRETYVNAGFGKWHRGPVWWRLEVAA